LAQNPIEVPGSLLEDTVDRLIQDTNTRAPKTAQLDPKNAETRNRFKEQALEQVRGVLILGHIARQEELTVTDAEVSQEVIQFARQNNIAPQEIINRFGRQVIEEFRGKVLIDKAMERVVELAKITELT
jgi:FKBP-type peptidyl-prolyl cis-trans isomerase (trigger factor)